MLDSLIYVDHAATTPLHPDVARAMAPYLMDRFGNPSSLHRIGREAQAVVDRSRATVAEVLDARSGEIVFTSGGSEAINTAIKGVAFAQSFAGVGKRIISTQAEHHAALHTLDFLERFGFETIRLPVDHEGLVDPDTIARAITPETILVSVMLANNEVGAVQPIAEIAAAVRARGRELERHIPIHTDAVQAPGQLSLDVQELDVDLLSLSAHKFRGPKGMGLLYLRRGAPYLPQIDGGGQERNRRAGTENVPGIVGLAEALRLAELQRPVFVRHTRTLRDRFFARVLDEIPHAVRHGPLSARLPNNANVGFDGVDGQILLEALDEAGIAASSGSACTTASWEPSHVLLAMGADQDTAAGSLRCTFGLTNTAEEVDLIVERLRKILPGLRDQPTVAAGKR